MKAVMFSYGIFWLCLIYLAPCCMFFWFYGWILFEVRQRCKKNSRSACLHIMDKLNNQVTRTLIIVTVVFIFTLGWDSWYCLLGFVGIVHYEFNSPLQMFGVFLSVMNSSLNPVVYLLTMPVFRTSVRKTFFCIKPLFRISRTTMRQASNIVAGIVNPAFVINNHHMEHQNRHLHNEAMTPDAVEQSVSVSQVFAISNNINEIHHHCTIGVNSVVEGCSKSPSKIKNCKCQNKNTYQSDGSDSQRDNIGNTFLQHDLQHVCGEDNPHRQNTVCIHCYTKTDLCYCGHKEGQWGNSSVQCSHGLCKTDTSIKTISTNVCMLPHFKINIAQVKVSTTYALSHRKRSHSFTNMQDLHNNIHKQDTHDTFSE